mgnify:CR=1 FL=1
MPPDWGATENQWRSLWVSGATIYLGGVPITTDVVLRDGESPAPASAAKIGGGAVGDLQHRRRLLHVDGVLRQRARFRGEMRAVVVGEYPNVKAIRVKKGTANPSKAVIDGKHTIYNNGKRHTAKIYDRAKLLEGEVGMDKNFTLEADEVAAGFVLSCQARALSKVVRLSFDER